ncbi:hypothetical protein [Bacillus cereus group sp. Bce029]|uniref:hypothetical protein n=1 Tax=Bacillus cereus group sp. Bce029 TaxID=3445239 RepID=UPI00404376F1
MMTFAISMCIFSLLVILINAISWWKNKELDYVGAKRIIGAIICIISSCILLILMKLFKPAYDIFTIEVFGLSFNELLFSFLGAALLLSFIRAIRQ